MNKGYIQELQIDEENLRFKIVDITKNHNKQKELIVLINELINLNIEIEGYCNE